jgi:hypothetical protein
MNHRCTFLGLILLIILFVPVRAEIEFGLVGQLGWTDNFYLENPDGWGMFAAKSLSRMLDLRFTFDRFDKNFRYNGIVFFPFPPPGSNPTPEPIRSMAKVCFYDLSIHRQMLTAGFVRFGAGVGVGVANLDSDLTGETTGRSVTVSTSASVLTLSMSAQLKKFIWPPFALRFGYKYRLMLIENLTTDVFAPFINVNFSSVHIELLARF